MILLSLIYSVAAVTLLVLRKAISQRELRTGSAVSKRHDLNEPAAFFTGSDYIVWERAPNTCKRYLRSQHISDLCSDRRLFNKFKLDAAMRHEYCYMDHVIFYGGRYV